MRKGEKKEGKGREIRGVKHAMNLYGAQIVVVIAVFSFLGSTREKGIGTSGWLCIYRRPLQI